MFTTCPSCRAAVPTISSRSTTWFGLASRHGNPDFGCSVRCDDGLLESLIQHVGMPLLEDWLSCSNCGYNGWPMFSRDDAVAFVYALEREAGDCARRWEFDRARRRYVRALAIFTDYAPALIGLAGTLIDETGKGAGGDELWRWTDGVDAAHRVLGYAAWRGEPYMPYVHFLDGWLLARTGRWEDAHASLTLYIERDRLRSGGNRFPDDPRDATDEARELLLDLPNRWARSKFGAGMLLQSDAWSLTPWRSEIATA